MLHFAFSEPLAPIVAALLAQVAPPPPSAVPPAILIHGHDRVRLNDRGVLLGASGMARRPECLADAVIGESLHAWIGVVFTRAGRRVSCVIPGDAVDYGGRLVATRRSFTATADRALAVHEFDGVEIRIEHWWQPLAEALVSSVTLVNRTTGDVTDPIVAFEWQLPGTVGSTWPPEFAAELPPPPSDVHRAGFMPNNLRPGDEQGAGLAYLPLSPSARAAGDLPFRLWTNATWPDGVNFGLYLGGSSTGDYDRDGWSDIFITYAGELWRNLDGQDWQRTGDYNDEMGATEGRYGCAIADLDGDGLADIGSEPRAWTTWCYDLLKNLGDGTFRNVANDPGVIDVVPCNGDCETLGVADVDGDGDLDQFLPAYPDWVFNGPGNFFLQNLGPDASGVTTWHEASAEAGLDNPDGVNRPEGTTLVDVDGDGDTDLYCNGTLYRNVSSLGTPLFEPLFSAGTGISFGAKLDEGAHFMDYDMDGDFDLLISFAEPQQGLRLLEARGDGSFFLTPKTTFDAADVSTIFGCSAADWDNDGDLDVTSTSTFRPNMLLEEGARHFTVGTHSIAEISFGFGTPAWFDFDHDGDLDCSFAGSGGVWFIENTLYDATTLPAAKRHVRVRVMRDSATVADGLETEFGAVVSVDVHGAAEDGRARVQSVAASAGYLNQGEYVLQFALPADPDPRSNEDVHFALSVDFKGIAEQGFLRVDRHVNPILGDIDLAEIEAAGDREIVVWRSGRVQIAGCDVAPAVAAMALTTTTGGLSTPGSITPLPAPIDQPAGSWYVGLEVTTDPSATPQRVEELLLDGELANADDCNGVLANVFAWDVTDPLAPTLLPGGVLERQSDSRNHRSALPVDFTLDPGRTYRIVARMLKLRGSPIAGPVATGALVTTGGLSFKDPDPCDGIEIVAATVDPNVVYAALRFRDEPAGAWGDLGHGFSASGLAPTLVGTGDLRTDSPLSLDVAGAPASELLFFVAGVTPLCLPFADGVLVPAVEVIVPGMTDSTGAATFAETWPGCLPPGASFHVQALIVDPAAPRHFAFTNALRATVPY